MVSVIDTNVLVGKANEKDDWHEDANQLIGAIDAGNTEQVHVTDYVIGETMNLVQTFVDHGTAIDLLNTIQDSIGLEIVRITDDVYEETEVIFRQTSHLSFVDASIVAHARRTDASFVYSFDEDFDKPDLDVDRREVVPS